MGGRQEPGRMYAPQSRSNAVALLLSREVEVLPAHLLERKMSREAPWVGECVALLLSREVESTPILYLL